MVLACSFVEVALRRYDRLALYNFPNPMLKGIKRIRKIRLPSCVLYLFDYQVKVAICRNMF